MIIHFDKIEDIHMSSENDEESGYAMAFIWIYLPILCWLCVYIS